MRRIVSAIIGIILFGSGAQAQRAGQLIAAVPVASQVAGSNAWRIRYWTTDENNQPFQATGMVVAPATPSARARPVLAWTHGTWGIQQACSPSASPNFWVQTPGLGALQQGMTVIAPDYIGLGGGGGMHPFLVGVATGHAVLDAVRAAQSVNGASAGRRFAVWGESQGGHAALWTAQVQPTYAPELQLVGAAAAAPPTSLPANLRQAPNAGARTFFTALIAASWSQHYGILLTFVRPLSRGIINNLANKCISVDSKPNVMTLLGIATLQRNLRDVDLASTPPWAGYAVGNSPQTGGFGVPLLIAQNSGDQLVAPQVTRTYAQALCRNRQRLAWITLNGSGGHVTSGKDSAAQTLSWVADRFAGRPAPSDCGRF